ncbi:hypothetical protein [Lacrimispora sp.]|uniref:hypothetical protein n=1 Tax=Lacrimispora sp. TaxID=2719234 RepID=UPI003991C3EA
MAKKQKVKISFRCEKCGKLQESDKEQSSELFEIFDCHEKCDCGGKFVMRIDKDKIDEHMGGGKDYATDLLKNENAKSIKKSLMCFETLNVIVTEPTDAKE